MKTHHLRYFLIVAEEQNFSPAAIRARIQPSPLSRAIKELESDLGVRLLQRNSRGHFKLTPAGKVFQEEAHRLLKFMETAQVRVKAAAHGYRKHLRIGLSNGLAQPRLGKLLAHYREEEPQTVIDIIEITSGELISALNQDQIDLGITVHKQDQCNDLDTKIVWWDQLAVAVPKNHPLLSHDKIPLKETMHYSLILSHQDLWPEELRDVHRLYVGDKTRSSQKIEYVSGTESMLMLVSAGYGVGVGLKSQFNLYNIPNVIVRSVTDSTPDIATYIVSQNKTLSVEKSRFIERAIKIGETANT